MYWPLGAPRIFAAPSRPKSPKADETQANLSEKDDQEDERDTALLGLQASRNGQIFATITSSTLDIWQTTPVVLITSVERSKTSLQNYGHNVAVLLRPDCSIAAVQTSRGFLVTYNLTFDPASRVYQQIRTDDKAHRLSPTSKVSAEEARFGQREIHIRFRMVIKVDAGIGTAIALDDELVVATEKPAAVQCIRWSPDSKNNQTSTELLNKLPWMNKKSIVLEMVYDRAMSLFVWISTEGKAFAVQKMIKESQKAEGQGKIFRGYEFHAASDNVSPAVKAAINARFSLLAIGCGNGDIVVYSARDYAGSLPLSHKLQPPVSFATTGSITFLSYSPDGYCLFVGYENGWVTWSVYGKLGGHSFGASRDTSRENDEQWLLSTQSGNWIGGGSELILTTANDENIWALEFAKSAVTGCFSPANISRTLLHTSSTLMMFNGHDAADIMSLSSEDSLWTHVEIPQLFLINQRPIRCAVVSPDGRYVAVAGRRGLAHYSFHSGRWKTFDDLEAESSFMIRGGMCWYQHILIAAVDTGDQDELRLYSRESALNDSFLLHRERLTSPAVTITLCGEDSLLVYTYENNLYHYVINMKSSSIQLIRVGQIGLHGIVRAPARVRAVTWYVPENQLSKLTLTLSLAPLMSMAVDGDPSQDVAQASVLFLVDAKLVVMQPTEDANGSRKYDMRIIANDVEYFSFTHDRSPLDTQTTMNPTLADRAGSKHPATLGLFDSLWYFDGQKIHCWPEIQELLKATAAEGNKELPEPTSIPVDFYPTSIAIEKAVVVGTESELLQRRDLQFAYWRYVMRTQLFLPSILRHYLAASDTTSALNLCHHYKDLSYFSHALELLLHTVLDEEIDTQPSDDDALLPTVLSFLSSFPDFLDIVVQCTRKTEVRSWQTLFKTLPSPEELFEESLQRGMLKTAGGYLIVLHTFEKLDPGSEQCIRLLHKAKAAGEWELCKELARFLMALDESGDTLRDAMKRLEMDPPPTPHMNGPSSSVIFSPHLSPPTATQSQFVSPSTGPSSSQNSSFATSPVGPSPGDEASAVDYFSK